MANVFKKQIVRYLDADGRQVTKDTPGACRVEGLSSKYYGRVPGKPNPVPLCSNKAAAEMMLRRLCHKADMASVGLRDPYEEHRSVLLTEHLDDFEADLRAKPGRTEKQVRQVASRARKVIKGCGFFLIADLSADRVQSWLADLRDAGRDLPPLPLGQMIFTRAEPAAALRVKPHNATALVRRHQLEATGQGRARRYPLASVEALRGRLRRGRSAQTSNFYLQAIKQFCRWMMKHRRMGDNTLAILEAGNVETDRRHDRRELTAEELRRLLAATRDSSRTFRGLTGWDRFHLYAAACGTGFRASALASLTPESFDLDADRPTVTLAARCNKNRKPHVQPLPPDVAELLRSYLHGRPSKVLLWPGTWASDNKGAEMLRGEVAAAGISYVVEGPDGPLYADFHSTRHTYLTLGGRAGIDLRTLQELAGHSTPTLTARYSHRRLHDLAGAVERLPNFLPEAGGSASSAPEDAAEAATEAG
jgi:integrase